MQFLLVKWISDIHILYLYLKLNKKLLINIVSSVGQVVVTGLTYFLLYGFWVRELGATQLGIWSIVWTTTFFAAIANSGVPVGVVKFIAEANSKGQINQLKAILTISVTITAVLNLIICVLLYPSSSLIFDYLLSNKAHNSIAISIFPSALLAFWVFSLSNVFMSALDGLQVSYLKALLQIFSNLILFAFSFFFISEGLLGIAKAYIIYTTFLVSGGIILLAYRLKTPFLFTLQWDKIFFKEFVAFALKSQFASVTTLLYDPVTKFFLAKYGTVENIAYYEMANRLVVQIRSIIVMANQVLIPKITEIATDLSQNITQLYAQTLIILITLSTPLFFALLFFAPFISLAWIGSLQPLFIYSLYALVIGWFINTLSVPAYFNNIGIGHLKFNIIQHIVTAFTNLFFSAIGGYLLGALGVVCGWSLSLIVSSWVLIVLFQNFYSIRFSDIRFRHDLFFWIILLVLVVITLFLHPMVESLWNWQIVVYFCAYVLWILWIIRNSQLFDLLVLKVIKFNS